MIVSDGLQAFTMESLARKAEVSSPLVYNYFSSRQTLLQALLGREYKITGEALFVEVMKAKSFEEVIRMFVANIFDHHATGNLVLSPKVGGPILLCLLQQPAFTKSSHVFLFRLLWSFSLSPSNGAISVLI